MILQGCAVQEPDVTWTGFGTKNVLQPSNTFHVIVHVSLNFSFNLCTFYKSKNLYIYDKARKYYVRTVAVGTIHLA